MKMDDTLESGKSLAAQARARLSEAIDPMVDQARAAAEQQKAAGVEQVSGVAAAVHRAADDLGSQLPHAAKYIHGAADKLEEASSALKERSLDDLMGTFGQFARSQPAAFFATAALAGFALSRFLKSSGEGVGRGANRSSS
jgi:methyl-accepting chemotaxis protein